MQQCRLSSRDAHKAGVALLHAFWHATSRLISMPLELVWKHSLAKYQTDSCCAFTAPLPSAAAATTRATSKRMRWCGSALKLRLMTYLASNAPKQAAPWKAFFLANDRLSVVSYEEVGLLGPLMWRGPLTASLGSFRYAACAHAGLCGPCNHGCCCGAVLCISTVCSAQLFCGVR